ncbi:hypothetical protein GCM10009647_076220 [Streptomyces sanglieri]
MTWYSLPSDSDGRTDARAAGNGRRINDKLNCWANLRRAGPSHRRERPAFDLDSHGLSTQPDNAEYRTGTPSHSVRAPSLSCHN